MLIKYLLYYILYITIIIGNVTSIVAKWGKSVGGWNLVGNPSLYEIIPQKSKLQNKNIATTKKEETEMWVQSIFICHMLR